jgi:hypothetical protein
VLARYNATMVRIQDIVAREKDIQQRSLEHARRRRGSTGTGQ